MSDQSIIGTAHALSNGRMVFAGLKGDRCDEVFIGFRNEEGKEIRLRVSAEAWQALQKLCAMPIESLSANNQRFGTRDSEKSEWVVFPITE